MDRNQEFELLFSHPTPPALEGSVVRARSRYRNAKRGKIWGIPLASLGGVAAAFFLLVNLSTPFARACGQIPVLRELASAVALSPSLRAAVEHDFVQPVGQKQTVNGVTMTVEYLIVDQKQVNVFYTLESEAYPELDGDPGFTTADGAEAEAARYWGYTPGIGKDLRKITLDFNDRDVPETLLMTYKAYPSPYTKVEADSPAPTAAPDAKAGHPLPEEPRPTAIAGFSFTLRFNPNFTTRGEVYELNREIILEGQKLTVKTVEVYPTHLRLNLADHPENTAWLRDLEFYLEDEKGNRYEGIKDGVSGSGDPNTPFMTSHRLESSYFGGAKHLTVHITGAEWLDKGREYMGLDLAKGTAENLPQGVTLGKAERRGKDVDVALVVQRDGRGIRQVNYGGWLDETGEHHDIGSVGSGSAFEEARTEDGIYYPAGSSYEMFTLKDCPGDKVRLGVSYSRYGELAQPVEIEVK